jgi:hypothetical protein
VAQTLLLPGADVITITVDNRLGEYIPMAERCFREQGVEIAPLTYVTEDEAIVIVAEAASGVSGRGAGGEADGEEEGRLPEIRLAWDRDANVPGEGGAPDDLQERCLQAFADIAQAHAPDNALVVTHGDLFNRYMPELFDGIGRYACEEAGYAVVRAPHTHGARVEEAALQETHRVTTM